MASRFFPSTDVFLGGDDKGELTIQVQESNPYIHLFDPEVIERLNITPQELVSLVNTSTAMEIVHNDLWGKKQPSVIDKTDGINEMSKADVVLKIKEAIIKFKEKYKDLPN